MLVCQAHRPTLSRLRRPYLVAYPLPMGLPNSFFTLFWALANPHHSGHKRARRVTEGIELFASVLFDPAEDPGLAESVATRLQRLDKATGDRFLFFVPLQPDGGWRPRLLERRPDVLQFEVGGEHVRPVRISSMETAGWALRLALGLNPVRAAPLIWFCRDPASREGYFVETSARQLRQQLLALSDLAEELPEAHVPEALVHERLSSLPRDPDAAWGTLSVTVGNNIAETLASVCAAALTGEAAAFRALPERLMAEMASRDHEAFFRRGESECSRATYSDERKPAEEEEEHRLLRRFAFAAICTLAQRRQPPETLPLAHTSWEKASRAFLRIGDAFAQVFRHQHLVDADHSIYAQTWAKAIEVELNASAAHLIRACAGVELPRFFELYDPTRGAAYLQSGVQTIDVNAPAMNFPRRLGAPWRGIALGTLRVLADKGRRGDLLVPPNQSHLPDETISAAFRRWIPDNADWDDLMRTWRQISDLRNLAAHPAPHTFTLAQADELRHRITTISALRAMQALQEAKTFFKPRVP